MVRTRRVSPSQPGWSRRRAGSGFTYLDHDGAKLGPRQLERVKALAIPPAWTDVWICPIDNGHLQAVGTDDAGRRQYLYHQAWRDRRDTDKFERVRTLASRLPRARRAAATHLKQDGMPKGKALATAFSLLDLGLFRIGGETYAETNGSFGLATLTKDHVELDANEANFDYVAKSGIDRTVTVADRAVVAAVAELRRRRGGGRELLAYRDGSGRWRDIGSGDINEYVKELVGAEASAKDFRTWHGTVLAAVALAERASASPKSTPALKRLERDAVKSVADSLGNTPAVARRSYVDPAVIDNFESGVTIAGTLARLSPRAGPTTRRDRIEKAVLRMLKSAPR